jgi:hypothetical protein
MDEGHSTSMNRSSMKGVGVGAGAVGVLGRMAVGAWVGETEGVVVSTTTSAAHAARISKKKAIPMKAKSVLSFLMASSPEAQKASQEGHNEVDPEGDLF